MGDPGTDSAKRGSGEEFLVKAAACKPNNITAVGGVSRAYCESPAPKMRSRRKRKGSLCNLIYIATLICKGEPQ